MVGSISGGSHLRGAELVAAGVQQLSHALQSRLGNSVQ